MKRFIGILLFGAFLFAPFVCFAEIDMNVDAKVGYFMPSEESLDTIYGSIPVLGADLIFWSGRAGISLGLSYMNQDGEPYTTESVSSSSAEIKMSSLKLAGLYRIIHDPDVAKTKGYPYFGLGVLACGVDETVTVTSGSASGSASVSETAYGLLGLAGFHLPLSEKVSWFVEVELSSASFENQLKTDVDVGGVTLFTGLRF